MSHDQLDQKAHNTVRPMPYTPFSYPILTPVYIELSSQTSAEAKGIIKNAD